MHRLIEKMQGTEVLVVGDLMLDAYLWGRPTRISPESPVMVVEIERETSVPGGAANVANNVMALGGSATVVGVVGDDLEGRGLLCQLAEAGAKDASVVEAGRPTTTKTRLVAQSQQLMRFDKEQVSPLAPATEEALRASVSAAMAHTQAVLVSDYAKGVVGTGLARWLVAECENHGLPLFLNAKPAAAPAFAGASLVTVNLHEAETLVGRSVEGNEAIARAVRSALGVKAVVVTLGSAGMAWSSENDVGTRPAVPVEVYDVAGAGDTVITTLALALTHGATLAEATELASLAASVVVGKLGVATASAAELSARV
ncbi:MAG: bifunctional heptose 7-phosphate kinase/heptose 1-phosphate adenyltransferase [Fimbriimonadaceae bacterium]